MRNSKQLEEAYTLLCEGKKKTPAANVHNPEGDNTGQEYDDLSFLQSLVAEVLKRDGSLDPEDIHSFGGIFEEIVLALKKYGYTLKVTKSK